MTADDAGAVLDAHGYGIESDCICGRNFSTVRGLREHLTKARAAITEALTRKEEA